MYLVDHVKPTEQRQYNTQMPISAVNPKFKYHSPFNKDKGIQRLITHSHLECTVGTAGMTHISNILITQQHFERYFTESCCSCWVLQPLFKHLKNHTIILRFVGFVKIVSLSGRICSRYDWVNKENHSLTIAL